MSTQMMAQEALGGSEIAEVCTKYGINAEESDVKKERLCYGLHYIVTATTMYSCILL